MIFFDKTSFPSFDSLNNTQEIRCYKIIAISKYLKIIKKTPIPDL